MNKKMVLFFLAIVGLVLGTFSAWAAEKIKYGTSIKLDPAFYLPPLAAEDKGFWKENGLDAEWVPFATATAFTHAVASGAINIGSGSSSIPLSAAERGVPVVIASAMSPMHPFVMWVRPDSPYQRVTDLKGRRIGVTALGAPTHVFARVITRAFGIEKDVRFVAAGGVPEMVAGVRVGAIDAMMHTLAGGVPIKLDGVLRELVSVVEYLPKPWLAITLMARKDFARSKPETVKRVIKAILQAADFMQKEPGWTIEKMKSFQGLREEAGKIVYNSIEYSPSGKIDRKAVENVRKFFIEYGVITEKTPPVDDLFTNEYIP